MSDIKVSVLTPIYNHDVKYTRKCLESLHAQTLKECEFILIDNGATPEAKALIEEFVPQDHRFKVIRFEQNQGYGKAMNAGLNTAKGEYIGIVESDDFIESNMYEELYKIAHEKDVDLVKSIIYQWNGTSNKIVNFYASSRLNCVTNFTNFHKFTECHASTWSAIYRRKMIKDNNICYDEEKGRSVGQDIGFFLETFICSKKVYVTNTPFYHYNCVNGNSSMKNRNLSFEMIKVFNQYDSILKWLERTQIISKNEARGLVQKRLFFNILCMTKKYKKIGFLDSVMIVKKLKTISNFTYFSDEDKKQYNELSKNPIRKRIFDIEKKDGRKKMKLFGITIKKKTPQKTVYLHGLFVKKKNKKYKKTYLFGIPVFYKKIKENKEIEELFVDLKNFIYQSMWIPQKVANLHRQVFPQFKNIHKEDDVVVVGCGPTLHHYFPILKAKHISCNRAFRYDKIKFDYAFIWDLPGFKKDGYDAVHDFLNYDCVKFIGKFLSENVPNPEYIENYNGKLYRCYSSARWYINKDIPAVDPVIHADLTLFPLADFMSISFAALHFASWTHPKRIFLVGLDTVINGSFDGRQNPYHFKEMFQGYHTFKDFMKNHYPETEIISINPVGLKGLFHDVYTQSYLNEHPELLNENVEILR